MGANLLYLISGMPPHPVHTTRIWLDEIELPTQPSFWHLNMLLALRYVGCDEKIMSCPFQP